MEGEVGGLERVEAEGWCIGKNFVKSGEGWVAGPRRRRIIKAGAARWRSRWGVCWVAA